MGGLAAKSSWQILKQIDLIELGILHKMQCQWVIINVINMMQNDESPSQLRILPWDIKGLIPIEHCVTDPLDAPATCTQPVRSAFLRPTSWEAANVIALFHLLANWLSITCSEVDIIWYTMIICDLLAVPSRVNIFEIFHMVFTTASWAAWATWTSYVCSKGQLVATGQQSWAHRARASWVCH